MLVVHLQQVVEEQQAEIDELRQQLEQHGEPDRVTRHTVPRIY